MHTLHNIHTIHTLAILPQQQVIDSVALFSHEFNNRNFDYIRFLTQLKQAVVESQFMADHDNSMWMQRCGCDFFTNPKLFVNAPLTYLCAFLGELFNNYEVKEIQEKVDASVIEQALLRLNAFKLH
ncbi:hypothetical protein [Psychromonas ossibalaenae]|uniref:hypothetical protein n=1 Tax=Psychromonas ossibalaenae TaxID=444922 RepID=UPI00036F3F7C|nr:hypothetical protein [Psychromonas ossibalaenae]